MKQWRAVCLDGFTVEAKGKDREEVVKILFKDEKMLAHIKAKHPEFTPKIPEQKHSWMLAVGQLVV